MELSLIVSVVLLGLFPFCVCVFFKRVAMFNIVKYDASPPLPASRTVINFRARSAELDCIMHSTHVHHQNGTRQNVCK